ncbi:Probable lipoprotein Cj1090c [hydrothermal vent metagenome]|uniref:Probable lipoprotein Cj1090c n=1 Tax=hydrothermal vent metagenome TaxID=652676 RepID=A0A1W1CZI8_9ZZZZ
MQRLWFLIATLFLLTACGYKPSSHYSKKIIGQKVYTEVEVSLSDPENAVLVKDALNRALYTRLRSQATRKEDADSSIKVSYKSIHFIPLQYNSNGYVVYYQANITLKFIFEKGKEREERSIVGHYEFPIRASAIISNDLRFKAIEQGSVKALDEFISYISAKGLLSYGK